MSKGTILYIGGFELPDKNAAAQRVLANAPIFRELGYNVVLIGVTKEPLQQKGILQVKGFDYFCEEYPTSMLSWLRYLSDITVFKDVIKAYGDVKAIICYNFPSLLLWKIKSYCHGHGIKVIGDATEWYQPSGNIIYRIVKTLDVSLRMRVIHPRLDGLIPTSQYLYDFYKDNNHRLLLLPTLVDLGDEKWKVDLGQNDDSKVRLIYAGSTGIGKDELSKALDLLAKVKQSSDCKFDFSLRIIGMTLDQYRKSFSVKDVPLELRDNVFFTGRIPHEEVIKEVAKADFFFFLRDVSILTSAGFPTKFSESISCGTPVITTKTSDLEKYVIEGANGYFIDLSNEPEAINKMIYILTLDKSKVGRMKSVCKQSRLMDYRQYIAPAQAFLERIGL